MINDIYGIARVVDMITGLQIRAARFALRLSAQELAKLSGVSLPTIQRFEQVDGVPPSRSSTLINLQRTLEKAGIEFIGSPDDSPGIRIRHGYSKPPRGLRSESSYSADDTDPELNTAKL